MKKLSNYITANPNICHGQPCFAGTRIMVYLVLELLEAGTSPEEIFKDYYPKLTKKHLEAALHYAAELVKDEQYLSLT
ncbi:MAG: antitoxin [Candidatus Omnitrophica bacterium CG08_land_8_20_14_0_20_41_16]|nr:MAG: antitoxin [Candidatus Omnitrophica bacterium CG08_land_8_20_14_0_20_41_16]